MPDGSFYDKAMQGLPALIDHWLLLGDASPEQLGIILADTARVAKLGEPERNPDNDTINAWRRDQLPPLWAAKAAVFLLPQMPRRPVPRDATEAAAWAYVWVRLRDHGTLEQAQAALPAHLHEPLMPVLEPAWRDLKQQRLI